MEIILLSEKSQTQKDKYHFPPLCGAEMMSKHTCDMRLGGRALEESRSRQREAGMRNRGQIQLMYIIHLKMAL